MANKRLFSPTNFVRSLIKRKNLDEAMANAQKEGFEKTLGVWDLIMLGVGAIIGSGIFVMIGTAVCGTPSHVGAGPSVVISIILAGVACVCPALCYAEFASMIPVSGSAYT